MNALRHAIATACRDLATRASRDSLVAITVPVTATAPHALLAIEGMGSRASWDPGPMEPSGWTLAAAGEALRVESRGTNHLDETRVRATAALARLVEWRAPECDGVPMPRAIGGITFASDPACGGPWEFFADASFVVPRWCQMSRGAVSALRLVVSGREIANTDALADEAERVANAIEAPALNVADRRVQGVFREMNLDSWASLVEAALGAIREGRLEKVVAARRSHLALAAPLDPIAVVRRLRAAEPACARFAFERGDRWFLGATPECLVRKEGSHAAVDALAGSMPRRSDADDESARRSLRASSKDRREHAIVVHAIREALAPLCTDVHGPSEPAVRTLRHVHHLWTPLSARVERETHVLDLVAVLHPTPAVCGSPRAAAAAWIRANEATPRGWYAAPVGWFDAKGNGTFAVAIRSAVLGPRDAWLFAGAGIVAGSEPTSEYRETAVKFRSMLAALGVAT